MRVHVRSGLGLSFSSLAVLCCLTCLCPDEQRSSKPSGELSPIQRGIKIQQTSLYPQLKDVVKHKITAEQRNKILAHIWLIIYFVIHFKAVLLLQFIQFKRDIQVVMKGRTAGRVSKPERVVFLSWLPMIGQQGHTGWSWQQQQQQQCAQSSCHCRLWGKWSTHRS